MQKNFETRTTSLAQHSTKKSQTNTKNIKKINRTISIRSDESYSQNMIKLNAVRLTKFVNTKT